MTRVAVLAVAIVLGAAGCGDDDDTAIPDGTTTTTATTSSSTSSATNGADDADADVTDRYLAYWDARFAANEEDAPASDEQLREYATGAQLEKVLDETARNRDEGIAFRHPTSSVAERRPTVVAMEGDTATLQDCAVTDGIVYRVETGEVIDDSVATHSIEATMRRVDGEWKLEAARLLQEWEGVAGCALAD